jgi:hypothetical protein
VARACVPLPSGNALGLLAPQPEGNDTEPEPEEVGAQAGVRTRAHTHTHARVGRSRADSPSKSSSSFSQAAADSPDPGLVIHPAVPSCSLAAARTRSCAQLGDTVGDSIRRRPMHSTRLAAPWAHACSPAWIDHTCSVHWQNNRGPPFPVPGSRAQLVRCGRPCRAETVSHMCITASETDLFT